MADGESSPLRYSAFISYSSHDRRFAAWLHRELESYRLPQRLAVDGGRRLKPLFHDTWELNAHHDLPQALREAIADSESLIVICSPDAARSDWVGREIELFRVLHPDAPIRAALVAGEPDDAFPAALMLDGNGNPTEPVAANFRTGGDRKLGVLKLVAALAGVQLDELVQRDGQRRTRRVALLAAASIAAMAVVSVLSVVAITSREAAERQRAKAEGLNEVMLTDVRSRLKRSGRLDLLSTVNEAVESYYRGQDQVSDSGQEQRAKLLQAMGEDDEKRGDLAAAAGRFQEARRLTSTLLAAKPDDPRRIFAQAQSEYYVGFIDWQRGDGAGARRGFEAYSDLARKLVARDPANLDWRLEAGYAESNLGMLALRQTGDAATAERHFTSALQTFQKVADGRPKDADAWVELADGHAWLADTQRVRGDVAAARASRLAQRRILENLLVADPLNVDVRAALLTNQLAMARIEASRGQPAAAIAQLDRGHADAVALMRATPDNTEVARQVRAFELFKVSAELDLPRERRPSARAMARTLGDCAPKGAGANEIEIADFCSVLTARLLAAQGDRDGAQRALAALHSPKTGDAYSPRWGLNFAQEARRVGR